MMFKYKRSKLATFRAIKERYYTRNEDKLCELEGTSEKYIEMLREMRGTQASSFAALLLACEPGRRCRSVVCPLCSDAAKRKFRKVSDKLIIRFFLEARKESDRVDQSNRIQAELARRFAAEKRKLRLVFSSSKKPESKPLVR